MALSNKPIIDKDLLAAARAALADRNTFIQSLNSPPRSPRNGRHRRPTPQAHGNPAPASSARDDRTDALQYSIAKYASLLSVITNESAPQPIPHAGIRAGEIIGYRAWWVVNVADRLRLRSLAHEHVWEPGKIEEGNIEEVVKTYYDACFAPKYIYGGVYSFKDASLDPGLQERIIIARNGYWLTNTHGLAIGTIYLWGDVVEHETGWRASHAKLRSLDEVIGVPEGELREEYGV